MPGRRLLNFHQIILIPAVAAVPGVFRQGKLPELKNQIFPLSFDFVTKIYISA